MVEYSRAQISIFMQGVSHSIGKTKIEDIDVKSAVRKCIRITKKQNNAMAKILLNEITLRGTRIHESDLYREMVDSFIYHYYEKNNDVKREHGSMRDYIYKAMLNNENVDVSKIANMFNSSKNAVSATKSQIKKMIMKKPPVLKR